MQKVQASSTRGNTNRAFFSKKYIYAFETFQRNKIQIYKRYQKDISMKPNKNVEISTRKSVFVHLKKERC